MAKGQSKIGGSGGRTAASQATGRANTPSGVSMSQFSAMSDNQKIATINSIINDSSIQVPSYLDGSDTSKVLYALGMNNKPTVVDDATLSSMPGREIFRTVYEGNSMPPPSSQDIADQIRNGDYTQMSGSGGSVHGRALYFATDFADSAMYGRGGRLGGRRNALIMRGKINPNAKIVKESDFFGTMEYSRFERNFMQNNVFSSSSDAQALYALSKGVDGWYSGSYTMMINRGALTMSGKNKSITTNGQAKTGKLSPGSRWAQSWDQGKDI